MSDLSATMDRVRKLLRLATNNPNPNEAANAAAQAQRLVDTHNLSTAMLEIETSQTTHGLDDEPIIDFADSPLDDPGTVKILDRWRASLAMQIAANNACKIYRTGADLKIIGRPTDADAVRYLYSFLTREVERLTTEAGRGQGRTWRNNFRLGIVDTITRKLKKQHDQFKTEARESAGANSGALVRIDQALARIAERGASVEEWAKKNKNLRAGSGGGGSRLDSTARSQGRSAGEKFRSTVHAQVSAAAGE